MCGIGLIVEGVTVVRLPDNLAECPVDVASKECAHLESPSVVDLVQALIRRGPDDCAVESIHVSRVNKPAQCTGHKVRLNKEQNFTSCQESDVVNRTSRISLLSHSNGNRYLKICKENLQFGPVCGEENFSAFLQFVGATLQLRGLRPISQPFKDKDGNLFVYNGEVFGGLQIEPEENDAMAVMSLLQGCCTCLCHAQAMQFISCECAATSSLDVHRTVPEALSQIRGPWALIFWQAESQILWFGRDAFGRRSLLVHWPSKSDSRIILSSVAAFGSFQQEARPMESNASAKLSSSTFEFWEELPCGVYSINITECSTRSAELVGVAMKHQWHDPSLQMLARWERRRVSPSSLTPLKPKDIEVGHLLAQPISSAPEHVLAALRQAVKRRTTHHIFGQSLSTECIGEKSTIEDAPVAILFSGGIDSMILAALTHQCLGSCYPIDLLNVSFDGPSAPDRISSLAGLAELQQLFPTRRWRLIEIDSQMEDMHAENSKLISLICPSNTYMDFNIGMALWLAASGVGIVKGGTPLGDYKYASRARILLVGAGADEQCAGYSRYRTKFRLGGWQSLDEEMRVDMQRIWKRNLGRDDRCMADHGKEARFPFLDEDVMETLLSLALWEITDLNEGPGVGDKKILREVARLLGLTGSTLLPKRAIQFGSGIARKSNKRDFGSNRAANRASAGSVLLCDLPS